MGPSVEGFDWRGVLTNHWLVIAFDRREKGVGDLYRCVSRCGIETTYRETVLGSGTPATCVRCREVTERRARPTIKVCDPELYRARFEEGRAMIFCDTSKVDGRSRRTWESHGLAIVDELVTLTGLGRDYGWKVFVRRAWATDERTNWLRCGEANETARSIELRVNTAGDHSFDVCLATGRTDRLWSDVLARIRAAGAKMGPRPEQTLAGGTGSVRLASGKVQPVPSAQKFAEQHAPAPRPVAGPKGGTGTPPKAPEPVAAPAATPDPVTNPGSLLAGLAGMDQEQITMLRMGLEEVALAGVEARSVQVVRSKCEDEVVTRTRQLAELEQERDAAKAELESLDRQWRIGKSGIEELERKLADAKAAQVLAEERRAVAAGRHEEAEGKVPAARDELEMAKMALEDAQRDERRVAESLKGAEKIGPILAALRAAGVVR